MLGAPAGGFCAGGHHGLGARIVLPMVPRKDLSPLLMHPSPIPARRPPIRCSPWLPEMIIRIIIMIIAREMQDRMPVRGKVQDGVQGRDQVGEVDLPGVTPSRQKRSREMTLALLQA